MIKTNVTPFIRVAWKHLFFENEKMQDLQVFPTAETKLLMRKMGIFFKPDLASMMIGYSKKTLTYLDDEPGKLMLTFALKNTNPYFQSITKLPVFVPDKKVFYFDNLNKKNKEDNLTLLHDEDFVSENDLVNIRKPGFEIRPDQGVEQLSVFDSQNNAIRKYERKNEPEKNIVLFNLQNETPGLFRIAADEKKYPPFYCFSSAFDNFFGMIHLYFDLEMLKEQGNEKDIRWNYEIRFANRETQWRYYFLNAEIEESPDFKISHPKNKIAFSPPQLKKLTDGRMAWELISNNTIPLKESYLHNFSVTFKTKKGSKHEVTLKLPNAEYQKTRRVTEAEEEKMYSDIYIHI